MDYLSLSKLSQKQPTFLTFDLVKEIYQPYKKPNDDPLYINIKANHPTSILQQLPKSISKRIWEISSNEHIFNQSILYYKNALGRSRYNISLKYIPTQNYDENNQQSEQRKRIVIFQEHRSFIKYLTATK